MYENISRRYRPKIFSSVVGQEAVITTLKNSVKQGRTGSAYIFSGGRGTGKTTVARLFAKALNCERIDLEGEPCNECGSCLQIIEGRSLDILEIDGASHRGIDDIRQINETAIYAATSRCKVYIIDEVHMLTKEAFNALLKTLEEPPSTVKFILATTEIAKIPATVLSRCQRFEFRPLSSFQIIEKLEGISADLGVQIEREALFLIASMAEGSLRDAESLLDQLFCYSTSDKPLSSETVTHLLGIPSRSFYFRLDQAIKEGDLQHPFELSQTLVHSGKELPLFLEGLIEHYRTLLRLKLKLSPGPFLSEADQKRYHLSSQIYSQEECLYILDYLIEWQRSAATIIIKPVHIEAISLQMIRSKKRISLASLIERLEALEREQTNLLPKQENLPKLPDQKASEKSDPTNLLPKQENLPKLPDQKASEESISAMMEQNKTALLSATFSSLPSSKRDVKEVEAVAPTFSSAKETPLISNEEKKIRYDTIVHFAAAELEGIFQNKRNW